MFSARPVHFNVRRRLLLALAASSKKSMCMAHGAWGTGALPASPNSGDGGSGRENGASGVQDWQS